MAYVPAAAAIGCSTQGPATAGDDDMGGELGPDAGQGESPDAPPDEVVHLCADSLPRLDLKVDCMAVGDGIHDDSGAFRDAAIKLKDGGELVIPPGIYKVGNQIEKTAPNASGAFYEPELIFTLAGVKSCLSIRGYGAVIKIADGLRYGGFDHQSGLPKDVTGRIQEDAAHVGYVFRLTDCDNVSIEGVEIDGNCGNLILGGEWGDVDRQTAATGIWLNRCSNVLIKNVHAHRHGLDGICVIHQDFRPTKAKPHVIENTVSEYNGRQGLSWIGGWGLTCTDCKFNHTGRTMNGAAPLASKPGAGLDIEPNANGTDMTRGGLFTRCEFIDNVGPGMVTAGGDGAFATFVDCTFWGTTSYAIWAQHAGLEFEGSRFYGTCTRASDGSTATSTTPNIALATRFTGCTFEDKPWTDGRVYRNGTLYTLPAAGESQGVTWTECTFINHAVRSVIMTSTSTREVFDRCTFTFSNTALASGASQPDFQGSRIVSCTFAESATVEAGTRDYFVSLASVVVGTPAMGNLPTRVDATNVHWRTVTGPAAADIAPGTYSS